MSMEATLTILTALRSPRLKKSATKETQKKLVSVRHSSRKNPKVRQKEKKDKQPKKIVDLEEEELRNGVEELNFEEGEPVTHPPDYIPLWNWKKKVTKDPNLGRFMVSMPLLPE